MEELRFEFGPEPVPEEPVSKEPVSEESPADTADAGRGGPEEPVVPRSLRGDVPSQTRRPGVAAGSRPDAALSIADFYARVRGALREQFPEEVWITGEIRKVSVSRGHRFLELADRVEEDEESQWREQRGAPWLRGGPASLEVACWSRDWPVVSYELESVGVELHPGLVVRIRGRVSVWEGASRLRFSMTALDVEALVGGITAARRRLLAALEKDGLLHANRRLPAPLVPLRVGLVTSPGSEAYRDFTGQLERSGYNFNLRFEPSVVQGPDAPARIAAALKRLEGFRPHLTVIVRGGGAKGDLAAFDSEPVARAIACAPFPVWTGIGHTGDRSVADEVASRALVTPTQCGEAVAAAVASYLESVERRSRRIAQFVTVRLDQAVRELAGLCTVLGRAAHRGVEGSATQLRVSQSHMAGAALVAIERSQGRLVNRAQRLAAPATGQLAARAQEVAHRREMLAFLDPRRQLERGWSLTRDEKGRLIRSVAGLGAGDRLVTTFSDGRAASRVDEVTLDPDGRGSTGPDGGYGEAGADD